MMNSSGFGFFEDDLPEQRRAAELVLKNLYNLSGKQPDFQLKQKILSRLNFTGDELSLNNLPATNKYSNYLSWLKVVHPFVPKESVESIFMHEFRRDKKFVQSLVISKVDVPEESHENYIESFFILEGRCVCTLGGKDFELAPGDFLDIPPRVLHNVRLLCSKVTAILQYQLL